MHIGSTLKLLRLASGMGLRDLARRLGVSGAYLSRVENGIDPAPTISRLEAMAREFAIPPTLLIDLAHQAGPVIMDYVGGVPEAASVFLQIAHKNLDAAALAKVRAFVESEFPTTATAASQAEERLLSNILTPERVVLGFTCSSIEDVLDVALERLREVIPAHLRVALSATLAKREQDAGSFIGGGVAVPSAFVDGTVPAASLITLAKPLVAATPDKQPLKLFVLLLGPPHQGGHLVRLAQVARLATAGLADRVAVAQTPEQALSHLAVLEAWR